MFSPERKENIEDSVEFHIQCLEKPTKKLIGLLKEKIDRLEYDSVLGDDAEARIHSILFSNILKDIYGERKNLETVFVQGGTLLKGNPKHEEEVREYLQRMKEKIGRKALIITEEIFKGESVEKLALILRSMGIESDIAAFGAMIPEEFKDDHVKTPEGIDLYIGGLPATVPSEYLGIWSRRRSTQGHAVKVESPTDEEREKIRLSREVAKNLAHKIAEEYLKERA